MAAREGDGDGARRDRSGGRRPRGRNNEYGRQLDEQWQRRKGEMYVCRRVETHGGV